VFAGEPLQSERVLRLAHPVRSAVVISNAPFIAPLAEQASRQRVCVALIDERFARILRGSADGLREAISFGDGVHGRHDQGGWSQARYQRSIEEDIDGHLRHTARILFDMLRVAPYDMLLIACTEPLWPRAVEHLHAAVRATLREQRLSLDVPDATLPDVEAAVQPVLAEERREHEDALLAELREHRARVRDARSAAGLAEVLDSLVQRRVQALLYDAGLHAGGVVCQRCGWMGVDGDRCPMDGAPLERLDDVVESAVESAVGQSAEVLALHDRPDLGPLGGIAATLRY
jgi:peptide subunit release factor 1 (eRF1)